MDQEVLRSYRANLDGSNSYREAIEETETFSMDREAVEKYRDCDKKKLKNLDR